MRKAALSVLVLALTLPTMAWADWAWTHWTMDAREVAKASKGKIKRVAGRVGERVNGWDLRARGRTSQDGMNFQAQFYFDPDGKALHVIRLTPEAGDCPALLATLKTRYGAPTDDSRDFPMAGGAMFSMTALKWSDPASGDFIAYTANPELAGVMAAGCFVRYRPIAEADPATP